MALLDCAINKKCCTADGGRHIFPLFSSHPGGIASSRVPTPGNLPSKTKKMLIPGGQPGGAWAQVELTDALQLAGSSSTVFAVNLVLCLKGNRNGDSGHARRAKGARSRAQISFPSLSNACHAY